MEVRDENGNEPFALGSGIPAEMSNLNLERLDGNEMEESDSKFIAELHEYGGENISSQSLQSKQIEYDSRSEAQSDIDMDQSLWRELPDHLIDPILARLPVSDVFRLRSVCKKWNEVLHSPTFLKACARVPARHPFFLMFADHFHRRIAAAYDLEVNKWHIMPFSFFLRCRPPESFLVLASAGGLLCLEGTGSQSGCFFISNPIARTWRRLPPMLSMRSPYIVGMFLQENKESYKILAVQDGDSLISQVYDSKKDLWEMTDTLPRRTALIGGASYHNGLVYCVSFALNGLLAFDLNKGIWIDLKLSLPPFLTSPHLVSQRGRLLLIGGLEELGTLKSVHVWQLNQERTQWFEIFHVPDEYFKQLFKSSSGHFMCVSHGDYVCMHEYYSTDVLMCNLNELSWHWLPVCPLDENIEARTVLGVAFEPRVEVS